MKPIRAHLTYANVMSSLAVFLLLGGAGAYAAAKKIGASQLKSSAVTTAKIKNGAVATEKLKNGAVSAEKLGDGAVTNAKLAPDSVSGDKVVESTLTEVPAATSANPLAFARVAANGTVDPANSKALTSPNVSHPSKGTYCVAVPSFSPRGGYVTTEAGSSQTSAQIAIGGGGKCAPGAVLVLTWNPDAVPAGLADVGFYLALYR